MFISIFLATDTDGHRWVRVAIIQWLLGNLSFYTFILHCRSSKVQNFLICEITLLLWWSCNKIRSFSFHSAKSSWLPVYEYLNVCEQLNLSVFGSYLNSAVDDTTWTQIWIFLGIDNVKWLISNYKIELDLHLCHLYIKKVENPFASFESDQLFRNRLILFLVRLLLKWVSSNMVISSQ